MAVKALILAAALFGTAGGAAPTMAERIAAQECANSASSVGTVYFPTERQLGGFPSDSVKQVETMVTSAGLVSIVYGKNFKVITEKLSQEQYVLTQCGTAKPTDAEVEAVVPLAEGYQRKNFNVPLQSAVAGSTTVLGFLRRLGLQDRVTYSDKWAAGACWQKAVSCGASSLDGGGSWGNATLRNIQLDSVEAAFLDCSGDCATLRGRSNAVHFPATKDNGNLHSAEYIKFIAAFFNLEDAANELFSSTITAYTSAATNVVNRPLVAWLQWNQYSPGGAAFELSQVTYKKQLVEAAGGRNVDGEAVMKAVSGMVAVDAVTGNSQAGKTYRLPSVDNDGNKSQAAKALFAALADVDVIIDERYASEPASYTFDSALAQYFLQNTSSLKFVQNKMIIRFDGTLGAGGGWDWLESRLSSPDWAVEGLARALHGDSTKAKKYFRNVAKGEQPDVISAASCSKELPSCNAKAVPAYITMLTEVSMTATTTKEAGSSGASGASVVAAAAATAMSALMA